MPKGFSILLLVIIYMTSEGINKLNNEKQLSFFFLKKVFNEKITLAMIFVFLF